MGAFRRESGDRRWGFAPAGLVAAVVTAAGGWPASLPAQDSGALDIMLDTTFATGARWRRQAPDPGLLGIANGGHAYSTNADDGDLAFEEGDVVSAASRLSADFTLDAGRFGVFARGRYAYDPALEDQPLFDSADYGAGKEFDLLELRRKQATVREEVSDDPDLQDAYLYGQVSVVTFKAGRQTLDWGESLQTFQGLASVNALDFNRLYVPGYQVTEALEPAGQVWTSVPVAGAFDLELFYQYEWRPTVLPAAGTFWSVNDYLPPGGTQANLGFGRVGENTIAGVAQLPPPSDPGVPCAPLLPVLPPAPPPVDCVPAGSTIPRAPDVRPGDDGQYGGRLRLPLGAVDLSLYAARYHSRLPLLSGRSGSQPMVDADTASYFAEYPRGIELYGASFNAALDAWGLVLSGEYGYSDGQPLQIDDIEVFQTLLGIASQISAAPLANGYVPGWRRHEVSQASFGLGRSFGPRFGFSQLELLAEVGAVRVHDLPDQQVLRYEGPGTDTPGDAASALAQNVPVQDGGYANDTSWGYRIGARVTFDNVLGRLALEPALQFDQDMDGISPAPLSRFVEGRRRSGAILGLRYGERWSLELGRVEYAGGGRGNLLSDRDFVDLNLKLWL